MRSRTQLILLSCLILNITGLSVTIRAAEKEAAKAPVRVAIFDYPESSSKGPENLKRFLVPQYGFQSTIVSPQEIRDGVLKDYDVIILPGGSGGKQARLLMPAGREAIRTFVRNGGGYVGICAGSYLASSHYKWSLGLINARVWDRQHWARGKTQVTLSLTPSGREVLSNAQEQFKVFYQNGPLLVPDNQPDLPGYEVLARFQTEVATNGAPVEAMVGTHAIIRSKFGAGRVICFSPHPETKNGPKSLMASGVYWAANAD